MIYMPLLFNLFVQLTKTYLTPKYKQLDLVLLRSSLYELDKRPLIVLNTEFDDCRFNRYVSNSFSSIVDNNR